MDGVSWEIWRSELGVDFEGDAARQLLVSHYFRATTSSRFEELPDETLLSHLRSAIEMCPRFTIPVPR